LAADARGIARPHRSLGSRVVLTHRAPPGQPSAELTQKRLTFNSTENRVLNGAISPGGKYLAYSDAAGIHVKLVSTGASAPRPSTGYAVRPVPPCQRAIAGRRKTTSRETIGPRMELRQGDEQPGRQPAKGLRAPRKRTYTGRRMDNAWPTPGAIQKRFRWHWRPSRRVDGPSTAGNCGVASGVT
jgi:hypothetical protein